MKDQNSKLTKKSRRASIYFYDNRILFFPKYEIQHAYKERLKVIWFETQFSQSQYRHRIVKGESNACTLIAILTAVKCHLNGVIIKGPEASVSCKLICALAMAMLLGNYIHDNLKLEMILTNYNLTVPEALKYAKKCTFGIREWKCEIFLQPLFLTLYSNLTRIWNEWKKFCKNNLVDLYIVLICDSRSVLIIFQNVYDTVTIIDSHLHTFQKGAFVATVYREDLKLLCAWFVNLIYQCYKSNPTIYELALLYFRKNKQLKK